MRKLLLCFFLLVPSGLFAQGLVSSSSAPLTVDSIYRPKVTRDPLIESNVFGDSRKWETEDAEKVCKSSFSVYNLELTGIIEDEKGRQAILRDAKGGKTYILNAGRLTDSKKKIIPDVGGIIRGREVVLITSQKQLRKIVLNPRK